MVTDQCIYCGAPSYGNCSKSPHGHHEHKGNSAHCIFCGSAGYGSPCVLSPHKHHQHGHGDHKCIYCGLTAAGSCTHSPDGKHAR